MNVCVQTWYDYNMRWDPEKHGGVEDLRFPAGKVWKPDVLLYNRFLYTVPY